ncbi:MAG TPA: hypothetical protein VD738_06515 [Nitrospira sp.]|jgi:hypothetical protein|nr:hypothetical protein [Nitrospira sp.]
MTATMTPATRILDVLTHSDGCLLEDLVCECPDLTWNQIFLELDRLSRTGDVRLRLRGAGQYVVTLGGENSRSPIH